MSRSIDARTLKQWLQDGAELALGAMRAEYPVLILLATLGMSVMVSAADLITLYIGLELNSLSAYVLAVSTAIERPPQLRPARREVRGEHELPERRPLERPPHGGLPLLQSEIGLGREQRLPLGLGDLPARRPRLRDRQHRLGLRRIEPQRDAVGGEEVRRQPEEEEEGPGVTEGAAHAGWYVETDAGFAGIRRGRAQPAGLPAGIESTAARIASRKACGSSRTTPSCRATPPAFCTAAASIGPLELRICPGPGV